MDSDREDTQKKSLVLGFWYLLHCLGSDPKSKRPTNLSFSFGFSSDFTFLIFSFVWIYLIRASQPAFVWFRFFEFCFKFWFLIEICVYIYSSALWRKIDIRGWILNMDPFSAVSEELAEIHGEISDIFRALS